MLKEHAGQVFLLQRRGVVFVHLALDIHPGAIGLNEFTTGLFIDTRRPDQRRHRLVDILDQLRVHGDIAALDRRRQHVAVTVVDSAALGIERLGEKAARIRALTQLAGVHDLIVGKAIDARSQTEPNAPHDDVATRQRRAREPFGRRVLARPGVMHLRTTRTAKSRCRVVATGRPRVVRWPTRSLITRTSPR